MKLDFSVSVTSLKSTSLQLILQKMQGNPELQLNVPQWMVDVNCVSECLATGFWLVFFISGPNLGGNSILAACNFHMLFNRYRPLSQIGSRRKRCSGQFGQDCMGSIPATPSTKHALCLPPSSMPASIEISIKLIVCLTVVMQPVQMRLSQFNWIERMGR